MTGSAQPHKHAAAREDGQSRRRINLALQGGGSYGAFTWGVLDALLADPRIELEGISGTSAGAMNAVALVSGLARAQADGLPPDAMREAARQALARLWDGVGVMGTLLAGVPLPAAQAVIGLFSPWLAPYQANMLGINPLRQLIEREVDFDLVGRQQLVKLFVTATNVRTGRGEVFSGARVTADALMASACLPMLFKAVEIDGEHYWDGGYSGNPALYPLIYETQCSDVLLVQISPQEDAQVPTVSADIFERINQIAFNASLLAELRAIEFVRRLLDENRLDASRYKNVRLHRIDAGNRIARLGSSTRADSAFLERLFALGREDGAQWIRQHFDDDPGAHHGKAKAA
ncbi:MAG: patatin-like phospholipase family protein [Burkholderiaceae bacterium]|jgi:NTE family protein|nr:patatin-like phospholipase family protein [Burkholderiaceae bacterium]